MDNLQPTKNPQSTFLLIAAVSGFLSVSLGAFAAHGLKKLLSENLIMTFVTGGEDQAIHTLALLAIALLPQQNRWTVLAGWSLIAGIILFSGSLYALAITGIRPIGIITPFGGLCFLAGWGSIFLATGRIGTDVRLD